MRESGAHYNGPLPPRKTVRPEGTPKLVALMAYPCPEAGMLRQEGYIDLMPFLSPEGDSMCFDLPRDGWPTVCSPFMSNQPCTKSTRI